MIRLETRVFRVPTAEPEADGTLEWDATTVVAVLAHAEGVTGLGWCYSSRAAADVVDELLAPAVRGLDADDPVVATEAMRRAVRNIGRSGVAAAARSAVDIALWDRFARSRGTALADMLGRCHENVTAYGSGGFTSETAEQTERDIARWLAQGMRAVKIKIAESWGSRVDRDLGRVELARGAIGPRRGLMVDANGGYTLAQAVAVEQELRAWHVAWFEEPVSSDDRRGLALLRAGASCDVAAGEYIWCEEDASALLDADAVDCLQLDITRCGGVIPWFRIATLAAERGLEVSAHCAPQLSAHVAAATPNIRHLEFFRDHELVDARLFDGVLAPVDGRLHPDSAVPGHGTCIAERAEELRVA